jgi:hypothetical protein
MNEVERVEKAWERYKDFHKPIYSGKHMALRKELEAAIAALRSEPDPRDAVVFAARWLLKSYDPERAAIDVEPDAGCLECTVGTTPYDRQTGPCPYHSLLSALAALDQQEREP